MKSHTASAHGQGHYRHLAVELVVDFAIMYLVMYTMIATLDHFHFNLNNVYMTLMMVAPMAAVMLLAMRAMFPSRRTNIMILLGAAAVFAASFVGMRTQAAIGDTEFLRSMIPHHSGDPDVRASPAIRSGDPCPVPRHRAGAEQGDRADEGDPCAPVSGPLPEHSSLG
jgi:hypothetical protein